MRRRELIAALMGGAAVLPALGLSAQQTAQPTIGFLNPRSPKRAEAVVAAFRKGLGDSGFSEGGNVAVEYRWGDDHPERLQGLAAELVQLHVAAIVAGATDSVRAAMAATQTIPIIFTTAADPVRLGFVSSLSRPTGNVTGATFYSSVLAAKRIELLHELVPDVVTIGLLANPNAGGEPQMRDSEAGARSIGKEIRILRASTPAEMEAAFASLAQLKIDALLVTVDPLFDSRPDRVAALAQHYAVPTVFYAREFVAAGGLVSYGAELTDAYQQAGLYAGRILKGAKVAELPVVQPTRFQLVINHRAATALGLAIPPSILARADEVIE